MSDPIDVSEPLDYEIERLAVPRYTLLEVSPIASSEVTLTPSATQTINFRYGGGFEIYNHSLHYLSFLDSPAVHTATVANFTLLNNARMSQIQLRLGGVVLADVNNALEYSNCVTPATMPLNDFLNLDIGTGTTTASGVIEGFRRSNNTAGSLTPQTDFAVRPDGTSPRVDYTDFMYVQNSSASGAVAQPVLQYKLNFGMMFPHTLFSVDKDIPSGNRVFELKIVLAQGDAVGYKATTKSGVSTGAAAQNINSTISNIKLFVALEDDPDIVAGVNKQYNGDGMEILTDYVYDNSVSQSGTAQSVNHIVEQNNVGGFLKGFYFAPYNATTTANTALEHSNLGGNTTGEIKSFRTLLNGKLLGAQFDINLTQANMEDWVMMKPRLKGSVLGQSSDMYQFNWVYADLFGVENAVESNKLGGQKEFGLSLKNKSYTYTIQAQMAGTTSTRRWLVWAVVSRRLKLKSTEQPVFLY